MVENVSKLTTYLELADQVGSLLPKLGETRLLLIDGPAGSGKTTAANSLALIMKAPVVHLDSIYDGWENALSDYLISNLHRWILDPIRAGGLGRFQRYDWHESQYLEWVEIPKSDTLIIEGVGAGSRSFRKFCSLLIWVEVSAELGLARVLNRDGAHLVDQMIKWQASELDWHQKEQTKESADLLIDGQGDQSMDPNLEFKSVSR